MKYFKTFELYSDAENDDIYQDDFDEEYDEVEEQFGHFAFSTHVYHGSRKPTSEIIPHDGMFFTDSRDYARAIGGQYIVEVMIFSNHILDLEKYNDRLAKYKLDDLGQGFFTIHKSFIDEKWKLQMIRLEQQDDPEIDQIHKEFMEDLELCDTIKGEDVGNKGYTVWYVKSKEQIYGLD
jgi:hypothetical protein